MHIALASHLYKSGIQTRNSPKPGSFCFLSSFPLCVGATHLARLSSKNHLVLKSCLCDTIICCFLGFSYILHMSPLHECICPGPLLCSFLKHMLAVPCSIHTFSTGEKFIFLFFSFPFLVGIQSCGKQKKSQFSNSETFASVTGMVRISLLETGQGVTQQGPNALHTTC